MVRGLIEVETSKYKIGKANIIWGMRRPSQRKMHSTNTYLWHWG
jgi:hypothetical protein